MKLSLRNGTTTAWALWAAGLTLVGCSGGGEDPTDTPAPATDAPTEPTATQPPVTQEQTAPPTEPATSEPATSEPATDTPDPTERPTAEPTDEPTPEPVPFEGEIKFVGLADGEMLHVDLATLTAAISFEVSNFTLKAPGDCTEADAPCGHVHVNLDGDDGNLPGAPYNNAGASSPLDADFSLLDEPLGPHTITLELVYDDHRPTGERTSVDIEVAYNEPTITITDPSVGENITLPANKQVPVTVAVTDFNFAAPGECGDTPNCGHIHLLIDGENGNQAEAPYNTAGVSEDLIADFALLEANGFDPSGDHTIQVELHMDDHSPYTHEAAVATVAVKTVGTGDASMEMTSPASGSVVKLGNDGMKTVPLKFNLKNFTLKAPGACGSQENCGHVHVHVDDTDGDAPGAPYNNAGASTSMDAHFYWLDFNEFPSLGEHTVSITLHNDDHSAVIVNGTSVKAVTTFTTTPNDNPAISILSPATDATVTLDFSDEDIPVAIRYQVSNFTLKAPGQCGSAANCGHIHALLDGPEGNIAPNPYNNAGADSNSIDVYFGALDNPFDEHQVTLELHKDDHSPVTATNADGSKTTLADWVTFRTE